MQRARYTIPGMDRAEAIRQTKLAFDDLVNQFNAAQNTSGVEEALKPSIGATRLFTAYDPAQDCARGDADAKFPGQLGQVPVTKLKAQVPPHAGDNHLVGEPTSTKERMTK